MFEDLAAMGIAPSDLKMASQKLTDLEACQRLLDVAGLANTSIQKKTIGLSFTICRRLVDHSLEQRRPPLNRPARRRPAGVVSHQAYSKYSAIGH
jgi:hypothetical protein